MSDEVIDYDLEPKSFRIRVRGKLYICREPSRAAGRAYRAARERALKREDIGERRVIYTDGLNESDQVLLDRCVFFVFSVGGNDKEVPATSEQLAEWTDRTCEDVIRRLKSLGWDEGTTPVAAPKGSPGTGSENSTSAGNSESNSTS